MIQTSLSLQQLRRVRVLLLAHGLMGYHLLKGLLDTPSCEVIGVFCWSWHPKGKKYHDADEKRFIALAKQHKIPPVRCKSANDYAFVSLVEGLKPDILLMGTWGEILKSHVLAIPGLTVINTHPSLLPQYKGSNPYVGVIRARETTTGVTFHLVDEGIDTGALLLQEPLAIAPDDTGGSLQARATALAQTMVPALMGLFQQEDLPTGSVQQPEDGVTYTPPVKMADGVLLWHHHPVDLVNQVRAYQPWLDCFTFVQTVFGTRFISIQKLRLIQLDPGQLPQMPPGLLLKSPNRQLFVATAAPGVLLELVSFKLYIGTGFLPVSLSKLVGWLFFKPNHCLMPPEGYA